MPNASPSDPIFSWRDFIQPAPHYTTSDWYQTMYTATPASPPLSFNINYADIESYLNGLLGISKKQRRTPLGNTLD